MSHLAITTGQVRVGHLVYRTAPFCSRTGSFIVSGIPQSRAASLGWLIALSFELHQHCFNLRGYVNGGGDLHRLRRSLHHGVRCYHGFSLSRVAANVHAVSSLICSSRIEGSNSRHFQDLPSNGIGCLMGRGCTVPFIQDICVKRPSTARERSSIDYFTVVELWFL